MNLNRYAHIIFDFDGTLADLQIDWDNWHVGIRQILQRYNPSFADERMSFERINDHIKIYGELLQKDLQFFVENYEKEYLRGVQPKEGPLKILRSLKSHQMVHLLTSNARSTITDALKRLKITHLFSSIVTRDDVVFTKPDPYPFSFIRDGISLLSTYLMIGDSEADRNFAKNVGIDFMHVDQIEK